MRAPGRWLFPVDPDVIGLALEHQATIMGSGCHASLEWSRDYLLR